MVGKPRHEAVATKLTKKSMKNAVKVVTREQYTGAPATSNETTSPEQSSLTPYERMRQLLAQRDPAGGSTVVDTAEGMCCWRPAPERYSMVTVVSCILLLSLGLKFHVQGKGCDSKLLIRMKLLWISGHQYKDWKLSRLHLVDANAPEPLEEMLKVRACIPSCLLRTSNQLSRRCFETRTKAIAKKSTRFW
jgi:hypothetical protein